MMTAIIKKAEEKLKKFNINKIDKNYLVFLGIYLFILLPIALIRFPDIRNELKYFIVTDSMISEKNFFILKYFSELYPDKPPLYFWILYFSKKYFDGFFFQTAVVLGSMVPSFFTVSFFYKFVKKIKDEKTAFISALALLSVPFFMGTSVFLRMDVLMSCFIFFSLYFFFNIYFGKISLNCKNIFMIYVFISLAVFAKGPAGFGIPVSVMLAFVFFEKNLKFLKKIYFIKGMFFILSFVGIWLLIVLKHQQGTEYINLLLGQETVGRIVNSKAHRRPFYYYMEMMPVVLFPYGITFLASMVFYIKNLKKYFQWDILEKIGFIWAAASLVVLSCASGKLEIYLLPVFPGMILLSVNFMMRVEKNSSGKILMKIMEISAVIPIFLNFFKKSRNFYKKMTAVSFSIFLIFIFFIPVADFYNKNYTLKNVVKILRKYSGEKIISYKFSDMKNLENLLNKKIIIINSLNEIKVETEKEENFLNPPLNYSLLVSRKKYSSDLKNKNFQIVYENKNYTVFKMENNN